MVLRIDTVESRLLRLESVISELSRLGTMDPERFRENLSEMWKVERGLQLGAEILLDIGNHILAGFRNVLVHDYLELDPARVLGNLERAPQQFSEFAQEIRDWLEGQPA